MPRKAYIADVQEVAKQAIPGISSVVRGSEDGDLNICFVPCIGAPIEIAVLALDVGEYPQGNMYMISTVSDSIPDGVNSALEAVQETCGGMPISDLVNAISKKLIKVLATGTKNDHLDLDGGSDTASDVDMTDGESEHYASDDEWDVGPSNGLPTSSATFRLAARAAADINKRIRADLRAVRLAGFKVGILSGMKAEAVSSMLSISVQVAKLGLSDEAIQAWDLAPQQYIVLLIRYSNGYKDFHTINQQAAQAVDVEFRIGYSNKYKPTNLEAVAAFTDMIKNAHEASGVSDDSTLEQPEKKSAGFFSLFISSSLNEFINQQFVSLLKIRCDHEISWLGAKSWFNAKQSRLDDRDRSNELPESYYYPDVSDDTLPDMLSKDHLNDHDAKQISFPLIAAQFALRYFVRCTEFCLVCHDKIEEQFDALKPYVCSKPLCLYQYMSLGFGPSVEHEVLTQPYVVDLLVSFCYASAMNRRLREYPTGMSLMVPAVAALRTVARATNHFSIPAPVLPSPVDLSGMMDVQFDPNRHEVIFRGINSECPVRIGDWVVITATGRIPEHFRIQNTTYFPIIQLSDVAVVQQAGTAPSTAPTRMAGANVVPDTPATTPPPPGLIPATFQVYDQNFDDMDDQNKSETIITLLETLPSIKEMRAELTQQSRSSEPRLRSWKDRVSPAALGLLRWIIASNRSCIVQIDKCPGQIDDDISTAKLKLDQRISNISDNYVQFRFAQGAPDKEQRFLNALSAQKAKLDPRYPTIFAWHGSPLQNWHSIIRSGLDFKETLHGRAYGHGVYHAMDQNTSVGYAQSGASTWQGSELNISSAMSLNEIINCPSQFASHKPYLVVQHVDWIQCRYLLVQVQGTYDPYATGTSANFLTSQEKSLEVPQDPTYTATSTLSKPIGIPQCAILTSRSFRADQADDTPHSKRRKHSSAGSKLSLSTTAASDSDEVDDLAFLLSDEENDGDKGKGAEDDLVILGPTSKSIIKKMTDFVPGSLDQASLPMLEPPVYATTMATKSLNRNLKEVLEIQKKTPLHELGWYIDAELVSNVYQWIVELHSFESSLPLAQDMKNAGITSIVLELRFGKDYPHSPPFVRVIRPRFLPFMNGGGGNVTAGGAMCMELLTNTGWSAVSSIESVLLQVRVAISNTDPRPARLESKGRQAQREYGVYEAVEAYKRACMAHGWQIPPDFGDFAANDVASSSGYM